VASPPSKSDADEGQLVGSTQQGQGFSDRIIGRLTNAGPLVVAGYLAAAMAFAMFFLQSDILYNSFVANQVARGHIDVYSWFQSRSHLIGIDTVMPPLYYLTSGLYLESSRWSFSTQAHTTGSFFSPTSFIPTWASLL